MSRIYSISRRYRVLESDHKGGTLTAGDLLTYLDIGNHAIMLGIAGTGKSHEAKTLQTALEHRGTPGFIVPLKRFDGGRSRPLRRAERRELNDLLKSDTRWSLIVDGVDEARNVDDAIGNLEVWLDDECASHPPHAVLWMSRPSAWGSNAKEAAESVANGAESITLELLPLGIEDVEAHARNLGGELLLETLRRVFVTEERMAALRPLDIEAFSVIGADAAVGRREAFEMLIDKQLVPHNPNRKERLGRDPTRHPPTLGGAHRGPRSRATH